MSPCGPLSCAEGARLGGWSGLEDSLCGAAFTVFAEADYKNLFTKCSDCEKNNIFKGN